MLSVEVLLNSRWSSSDHWITAFRNSSLHFWSGAPRNFIIGTDYTLGQTTQILLSVIPWEKSEKARVSEAIYYRKKKKKSWAATQLSFSNTFSPQVYHGCTWPSTANCFCCFSQSSYYDFHFIIHLFYMESCKQVYLWFLHIH